MVREASIAASQPTIAVAAMTLIDSAVSATTRHSDRLTTASDAAAALANLDEATLSDWLSKSKSVFRDRVMAVDPFVAANHRANQMWQQSLAGLRRRARAKWRKRGKTVKDVLTRIILRRCVFSDSEFLNQALMAFLVRSFGTSTADIIDTKRGPCPTRFRHLRSEGKLERTKAPFFATCDYP